MKHRNSIIKNKFMNEIFVIIITIVPTVLALVNVFQWFDKRAKNKALQNFLEAIHDIAKRIDGLKGEVEVQQKSKDICSVVNAAIITVSGKKEMDVDLEKETKVKK